MSPAEALLLSAAGGAVAALAPLVYMLYGEREATAAAWAGAAASFASAFVLTLLLAQWPLFYARFTYLLALALLATSIAYAYWGMLREWWAAYLFAAAAWIYIIVIALAAVARALGLADPFIA
jgi:hypothetical protein